MTTSNTAPSWVQHKIACQSALCRAPGCSKPRRHDSVSPYCMTHRHALALYGDPMAKPVPRREMKGYEAIIAAVRKRNPESPVWPGLADGWAKLVSFAQAQAAARDAGRTYHKTTMQAAEIVLQINAAATAEQVTEAALACYALKLQRPGRHPTERAFRFTLVRHVGRFASTAVGSYWNQKCGRTIKVYRPRPPRVIEALAGWLVDLYGLAGTLIAEREADRERRIREEPAERRQRLVEAVESMR